MTPLTEPAPCRLCGDPTWTADGDGPAHSCCIQWRANIEKGGVCPACTASKAHAANTSGKGRWPKRAATPTPRPPVVRNDDPWTSHLAARRVEPTRDTRKANVLAALRAADGGWVDGDLLATPTVGGSEGLRRCRELRQNDGWPIERRPNPTSASAWQYRLADEQ